MGFSRPRFTNAGRALQLRSIGGTQINFTKIKIGDGEITGGMDYKTFTDLISTKATLPLTGIKVEDGYAKITGYLTNEGITTPFNYRELGLFATDPDDPTNEILYCYANYGEDYVYIAQASSEIIEKTVSVVAIVDDAENVTATLDSSAVYVDDEDLADAIEQHNLDPNAHVGLVSQVIRKKTCYVDPNSAEASGSRDGTASHPFKYLKEAITAYPSSQVLDLTVHVTSASSTIRLQADDDEDEIIISGYDMFILNADPDHSQGYTLALKPEFDNIGFLYIDKAEVDFTIDDSTLYQLTEIWLYRCDFSILEISATDKPSSGFTTEDLPSYFLSAEGCEYVRVGEFDGTAELYPKIGEIALMYTSLSSVYFYKKISSANDLGFESNASIIYMFLDNLATAKYSDQYDKTLYLSAAMMDILSDGTFAGHFTDTNNPHEVTLAQAAAQGGILGVVNGGTGKNTFTSGALLKGNGANAVTNLIGSGALYSPSNGNPTYGTLPINMGGTGRTNDGVVMAADQTVDHGVLGSITFPGGICLLWGRLKFDGSTSASVSFGSGRTFATKNYAITFTEWDVTLDSITKTTTGFSATKALSTTKILDFMVVGKLA